jgi:hypothetical protein
MFFCDQVVPNLIYGITSHRRRKTLQGFMIHLDNANPHSSRKSQELLEANRVTRVQDPTFNLHLAPSDFFLLGYLTENPTDYDCGSQEDLRSAITLILDEIPHETPIAVFVSSMQWLKLVISNKDRFDHK